MKRIFIIVSKIFLSLFYDKRYFKGRWYENGAVQGYKWCWRCLWSQKVLRHNGNCPWPVSSKSIIGKSTNLHFDINDLNNFHHFGCYFQNYNGNIYIGRGTYIAPNVGLITENHSITDLDSHDSPEDIVIGKECWIGMNSILLPGVILGDNTIVGAGSIVTKSFTEGNCVIAGNPARKIKEVIKNENKK